MTLFNIMNEIRLIKQSASLHQFYLDPVCRAKRINQY